MASEVNADLARERGRATFDPENLTCLLYGGSSAVKRRRYLQNLVKEDPVLKGRKRWAFQNREERVETAMWKSMYLDKRTKDLGITSSREKEYFREAAAAHEGHPMGLHLGMIIPTIKNQATEEQQKKWLPMAESLRMIATYAQTELGHGTFIRGLETTATYDPRTEEFIMDTPTLTATKYWPGALGKTVNHCIVMAQLYTQGRNCGIHMFLVQIRDMDTHIPLPGVEVGDIGPKFGFEEMDNGFLRLNKVRIPRENMLMKYSKVQKDGTYIKPPSEKLAYGSMVLLRCSITGSVASCLAQACVISIRYSAVRRQTEVSPGGEEAQIIDYQTQQYKLFPLLGTSFAMLFAGEFISNFYTTKYPEIAAGNFEFLPQLHAMSAGLKAFGAWTCSEGVETCRLCCGGHGYSHASGLPKIYLDCTPACTYEGENMVLMLQVARFLMKEYTKMMKGDSLSSLAEFLRSDLSKRSCMTEDVALRCLVMGYNHRAARLVSDAASNIQKLIGKGKSQLEAWNSSTVRLFWAARAFCHAFVVENFVKTVTEGNLDDQTRTVMTSLCKLYAVHGIITNLGEFIQDGFFSSTQVQILQNKLMSLLADIRPNAVTLVDAFDYPDSVLQSCIGRYDGQVYQALYDYAKESPLNEKEVLDSYYKYIKPAQTSSKDVRLSRL
ncbi:peroxisomal acyl-coenzyme A oxidase 1-like [Ostrea edulis]|uniref:peroxisomal acyl-coenzyme A oxidase 1-like n=1 Tax=Ostrea edulis TaxID=37623 RepID=UPI0020956F6C|nr:peroxisomal acyl-coenzyme A oxidase 1-like [Ostrea edulis]XP_055998298.1 peroxisomal acyl-coenzyme A oxidase 1-like [Ostrea edulis]XP_055998299.1 peroxisomal acyl-coenzyme A oxidase 1-like [Ostrea edulis]XP_055998301.1 peroxisomal acyl-coenzyme A oxidase 1-like [Ostrea edulis]XP_055998302.1 peroxisomal acyl-coenzyme A oxidase 1-like [Ostrea edulis]